MKTVNYQDLDFFLLQMQPAYPVRPEGLKKEAEWRSIYGFRIWIPESFSLADKEVIEEVFGRRMDRKFFLSRNKEQPELPCRVLNKKYSREKRLKTS